MQLYALFDSVEQWNAKYPEKGSIDGKLIDKQYIYDYLQDYNNKSNNSFFYAVRTVYDDRWIERTGPEGFLFLKDYEINSWVREYGREIALSKIVGKLIKIANDTYDSASEGMLLNFSKVRLEFDQYFKNPSATLNPAKEEVQKEKLTRDQEYLRSLGR